VVNESGAVFEVVVEWAIAIGAGDQLNGRLSVCGAEAEIHFLIGIVAALSNAVEESAEKQYARSLIAAGKT
jgi:hypothetical protein